MNNKQQLEEFDFSKYWQIFRYHRIPAMVVFLVTCVAATVMAVTTEKEYEAKAKLKFTRDSLASVLIDPVTGSRIEADALGKNATPVDTEAEVLLSPTILNDVIQKLDLKNDEGKTLTYEDLRSGLSATNIPGTDILDVSYTSKDTTKARSIVNAMVQSYLAYDVSSNRAQAQSAKNFINQELPRTEEELKIAEANLRRFQERYGIVSIDTEKEQSVIQIGRIDDQIALAKARLEKVQAQIKEAELQLGISSQQALALNTLSGSPEVQQLSLKLKEVEDNLAIERGRFKDNNPVIISLKAQKTELEKALNLRVQGALGSRGNLASQLIPLGTGDVQGIVTEQLVGYEIEKQSLIEEIRSLEQSKDSYRNRAKLLPRIEETHRDLQRKLEASQNSYNNLLNNLQQVQILENQNVGNAQVISNAVLSKYPVSLSPKLILAGGIGLGGVLSIITAFLMELRNPSLKTAEELRQTYQYKLLGTTPNQQSQNFLGFTNLKALPGERTSILDEPYTIASEAYRMVHTNLQFLNDRDIKVITVSSSIPQEGKSTVSANLAAAISQMGKRVLIVDADLHRPQQHEIWGSSNQKGLAEVLREEASVEEATQAITPDIHLIPSGLAQPGESMILLKQQLLKKIIEEVEPEYDLVIFDTPPVLLFGDALVVAGETEGIVLVSRPGVTSPEAAKDSKQLLDQSGQNILGLIVNSVTEESSSHYKYAKGYYAYTSASQLRLPQKI